MRRGWRRSDVVIKLRNEEGEKKKKNESARRVAT